MAFSSLSQFQSSHESIELLHLQQPINIYLSQWRSELSMVALFVGQTALRPGIFAASGFQAVQAVLEGACFVQVIFATAGLLSTTSQ